MMKYLFFFYVVLSTFGYVSADLNTTSEISKKELKVMMLIIANDNFPIYVELQKIWRSYMHTDPEHIQAYFIKANPNLSQDYEIIDDTLWVKSEENWIPGILNKTMLSLEFMFPHLHEFDYVIRTNLSSFYVFPRLLQFLEKLPRKNCYCGRVNYYQNHIKFGSGAGFILSPDVAELLLQNKYILLNHPYYDDVAIGELLADLHVPLIDAIRWDFLHLTTWYDMKDSISHDVFQFRANNADPDLRMTDEIFILRELLKMFYNIHSD